MNLDSLVDYDFVFRSVDQSGAYCRYEALVSFVDEESGQAFLIYADERPDDDGEVATYASLCDLGQVSLAAAASQPGCVPKKPPVLTLSDPDTPRQWELVDELLRALEDEGEEG